MKKEIESKFWCADQNNSGGYYIQNDEVDALVIIEAINEEHAEMIFDKLTEYNSSFCHCCGERWRGLDDEPYETEQECINNNYVTEGIIHYLNGESKRFRDKVIVE